jgi:rsbT co-antagonist protein RsbR
MGERAGPTYAALSPEELLPRMEAAFEAMYQAVDQGKPEVLNDFVSASMRQRMAERYALEEMQTLLSLLRQVVLGLVDSAYGDVPEQRLAASRTVEELSHGALQQAFQVYLEAYEEQVELQRRTLSELSTPVIKVYENVLVLPLVGAIDTERARRIMEELLTGITRHQAELVIIDITGVPVVDTAVANHLIQTIKAARLLGARSILVGISGEVAQALVHLQIDLSGVVTRSNLQAGIEYALEQMGLEIVPRSLPTGVPEEAVEEAGR